MKQLARRVRTLGLRVELRKGELDADVPDVGVDGYRTPLARLQHRHKQVAHRHAHHHLHRLHVAHLLRRASSDLLPLKAAVRLGEAQAAQLLGEPLKAKL